jgi:hypothetical protein
MSPGEQNIKTGPDVLGTYENESGSVKQENRTRRPRYRQKLVPAQNLKTGPIALGTAENESRRTKHENGTGHPRYRRK